MKAMLVAIQPRWLKMILDGKKKYEFRNWKVPVGTVIYFYESKGKWLGTPMVTIDEDDKPIGWNGREGRGKVVAKAVVEDVYGNITCGLGSRSTNKKHYLLQTISENKLIEPYSYLDHTKPIIEKQKAIEIGWDWQRYALELDQVQEIEPKNITEFMSWNKDKKLTKPPQSRTWVYVEE